jgi:hypothetical protein
MSRRALQRMCVRTCATSLRFAQSVLRRTQLHYITAGNWSAGDTLVINGKRSATIWLTMAATALLLQACAEQRPSGPAARMYATDMAGAAKACVVPKVTPTAGQETPVPVKLGNDGGWCAITVSNGGSPYSAGLLTSGPAHGKVLIHTVGSDTRIDYTPERGFAGADTFAVKLIPGDAVMRASVSVGPP